MTSIPGQDDVRQGSRGPWWRWALAALFLLAALMVTGERLAALGVMRQSLTSSNEMTRSAADGLVTAFRLLSATAGLALIVLWSHLQAWLRTPRMQALLRPAPAQVEQTQARVFNRSGLALAAMLLGSMLLVWLHGAPSSLTREDGPYETFTALAFAVAGVAGLAACVRRGRHADALPLLLMSVFFLLAAGEEISWGQRLLDLRAPSTLTAYNVQGEMNVHNMFGYLADHLFIAGTFLYGAVIPLACARSPALLGLCWRTGWPVASQGLALGFLALSLVHDWTVGRLGGPFAQIRAAEIREAAAALAYLLLMFEAWRTPGAAALAGRAGKAPAAGGDPRDAL